jgi:hypothetical protein
MKERNFAGVHEMDESENLSNDPARLLLAEVSRAAFRQGNFQLAYLIDTSVGDICRHLRREAAEVDRFMAVMAQESGPASLAA